MWTVQAVGSKWPSVVQNDTSDKSGGRSSPQPQSGDTDVTSAVTLQLSSTSSCSLSPHTASCLHILQTQTHLCFFVGNPIYFFCAKALYESVITCTLDSTFDIFALICYPCTSLFFISPHYLTRCFLPHYLFCVFYLFCTFTCIHAHPHCAISLNKQPVHKVFILKLLLSRVVHIFCYIPLECIDIDCLYIFVLLTFACPVFLCF